MTLFAENTEEWRSLLLRRRGELLNRHRRVGYDLTRVHEPLAQDFADQATQTQNDEALEAIAAAAETEISAIDHALRRLELGQYGRCKHCHSRIDAQRLRIVPHATTCSECAGAM